MSFAKGTHAYGICERCGFRYDLGEMKAETFKGVSKKNLVCPDCWDQEHPQDYLGTFKVFDPQALRRPAPDIGLDETNAFPTIRTLVPGLWLQIDIGNVVVTT